MEPWKTPSRTKASDDSKLVSTQSNTTIAIAFCYQDSSQRATVEWLLCHIFRASVIWDGRLDRKLWTKKSCWNFTFFHSLIYSPDQIRFSTASLNETMLLHRENFKFHELFNKPVVENLSTNFRKSTYYIDWFVVGQVILFYSLLFSLLITVHWIDEIIIISMLLFLFWKLISS